MERGDILLAVPTPTAPTKENLRRHGVRGLLVEKYADGSILLRIKDRTLACRVPRPPVYLSILDLTEEEQRILRPVRWMLLKERNPPDTERFDIRSTGQRVVRYKLVRRR